MGLPSLRRSFPGSGGSLSFVFSMEYGLADSIGVVSLLDDGVSLGPLGLFNPLVSLGMGTLVLVFGVLSLVVVNGLGVVSSPCQVGDTLGCLFGGLAGFTNAGLEVNSGDSGKEGGSEECFNEHL